MDNLRPKLVSAWHALQDRVREFRENRDDRRRHLIHRIGLRYLLVVPVLLAILTATVLFVHSDVNVAMLFSQCHARARLPVLSRIPLLGAPSCFLVSFFQEALALGSARAFTTMSVVLSFVASLLTVSTVEAARICNGPSVLIAYPTGPWLVFNLMGGAMVWELLIIPAFFRRSQDIAAGKDAVDPEGEVVPATSNRHLTVVAEVVAIPVAVALGYVAPSLAMLFTAAPVAIAVWLFFPIYVSLIRQGVRFVIRHGVGIHNRTLYLESHTPSLFAVYAVPLALSLISHGLVVYSLLTHQPDDRQEMTRSTLRFIEIDFFFIVLTVLYWILVEAGWRVVAVVLGASVVLGPGAGLCLGWIYRERQLGLADGSDEEGEDGPEGDGAAVPGEETPLLR
ncbi:hypothetical protein SEUCBS139899_006598 [Sporothrix eucalyptigena]|uniref:Uncharacterized protein n=1 Tax=Sporothrix eucalyptigena TaxID=1812306 RepID=A0ABP0B2H4_9PEZI